MKLLPRSTKSVFYGRLRGLRTRSVRSFLAGDTCRPVRAQMAMSWRDPNDWPMMGIPPRWHVQPGRLMVRASHDDDCVRLCWCECCHACSRGPQCVVHCVFSRAAISAGILQAAPSADGAGAANTAHLCVFRLGACLPWAFQGRSAQETSCAACPWHAGTFFP